MSVQYREVCNGCGLWNELDRANFNRIKIDITNYVLFSSGFKLKEAGVDIFFCKSCYSKVLDSSMIYSTGNEVERLRKLIEKKDKEIEEAKASERDYHSVVRKALEGVKIK